MQMKNKITITLLLISTVLTAPLFAQIADTNQIPSVVEPYHDHSVEEVDLYGEQVSEQPTRQPEEELHVLLIGRMKRIADETGRGEKAIIEPGMIVIYNKVSPKRKPL